MFQYYLIETRLFNIIYYCERLRWVLKPSNGGAVVSLQLQCVFILIFVLYNRKYILCMYVCVCMCVWCAWLAGDQFLLKILNWLTAIDSIAVIPLWPYTLHCLVINENETTHCYFYNDVISLRTQPINGSIIPTDGWFQSVYVW